MSGAGGARRIEDAIRAAGREDRPAIAAFLTAGYPRRRGFADLVRRVADEADLVELGVPFTDPMADGVTIQDASRAALADGVTLDWILERVAGLDLAAPVLLMSYLNPLLTRSHPRLAYEAAEVGVDGFIVPDLPLEEADELRVALEARGRALVQLVTPLTPPARRARIASASSGFLYAVTRTGTTGAGDYAASDGVEEYLDGLRAVSPVPVLAGFGIRSRTQVERLRGHVDGVIVGSALLERLAAGEDPTAFLRELRGERAASGAATRAGGAS